MFITYAHDGNCIKIGLMVIINVVSVLSVVHALDHHYRISNRTFLSDLNIRFINYGVRSLNPQKLCVMSRIFIFVIAILFA